MPWELIGIHLSAPVGGFHQVGEQTKLLLHTTDKLSCIVVDICQRVEIFGDIEDPLVRSYKFIPYSSELHVSMLGLLTNNIRGGF